MDVSEIYNDIKVRFKSPILVRFFTIFLIYNWDLVYAAFTHYDEIGGVYSFEYIQSRFSLVNAIRAEAWGDIFRWFIPILILILSYVKWGIPKLNEWASNQLFQSKLKIEDNERKARKEAGFIRYELYERIVDQFNKLKNSANIAIAEYEGLEIKCNNKEIELDKSSQEVNNLNNRISQLAKQNESQVKEKKGEINELQNKIWELKKDILIDTKENSPINESMKGLWCLHLEFRENSKYSKPNQRVVKISNLDGKEIKNQDDSYREGLLKNIVTEYRLIYINIEIFEEKLIAISDNLIYKVNNAEDYFEFEVLINKNRYLVNFVYDNKKIISAEVSEIIDNDNFKLISRGMLIKLH